MRGGRFIGKVIKNAWFDEVNDEIHILFTDGEHIRLSDRGSLCCENRYMTVEDDLSTLNGEVFIGFSTTDETSVAESDGWETHEIQFLNIYTDKDSVQIATHNVHNGYYGGFYIEIEEGCE